MDTTKTIQDKLPVFADQRGSIETFDTDKIFVRTVAGSRRAAHYHKTTGHLCYVTKGEIIFYDRPVGSNDKPIRYVIKQGQAFWTGPMVEHLMVMPIDTDFVCFSTGARSQKDYELDLVRLDFDLEKIYNTMAQ